MDEANLVNCGRERVWMDDVINRRCLAKERPNLATIITREIGTNSSSKIGGFADIKNITPSIAEEVDAR
jgi:hypothetical protein